MSSLSLEGFKTFKFILHFDSIKDEFHFDDLYYRITYDYLTSEIYRKLYYTYRPETFERNSSKQEEIQDGNVLIITLGLFTSSYFMHYKCPNNNPWSIYKFLFYALYLLDRSSSCSNKVWKLSIIILQRVT
jgi:hypothetical protein